MKIQATNWSKKPDPKEEVDAICYITGGNTDLSIRLKRKDGKMLLIRMDPNAALSFRNSIIYKTERYLPS